MSIKSLVLMTSLFLVLSGTQSTVWADYTSPGSAAEDEIEAIISRNQMSAVLFDQEQSPHLSRKEIESRLEAPSQKMKEYFVSINKAMKVQQYLDQFNLESEADQTTKVLFDDVIALNLAIKLGFSTSDNPKMKDLDKVRMAFNEIVLLEQVQNIVEPSNQDESYTKSLVMPYFVEDYITMKFYEKAGFSTNPYAPYYAWGP
jgi:hypothetical protein